MLNDVSGTYPSGLMPTDFTPFNGRVLLDF
jgi:hypothetical protein